MFQPGFTEQRFPLIRVIKKTVNILISQRQRWFAEERFGWNGGGGGGASASLHIPQPAM